MTLVEAVARRERQVLVAALIAIPLLCWAWIVPMARDMYGAMTGPSAWMMTTSWDARHLVLLCAMWTVMMIGMMLPSATPMLLMFAAVMRRSEHGARGALRVYPMAAGYLSVWVGFSVAATVLQRALSHTLALSPMMKLATPTGSAIVLTLAAVYQVTPFKQACLDSCRSPVASPSTCGPVQWARTVLASSTLPGLLLGSDAAVCRRRDEPDGHRRTDDVRRPREGRPARPCWVMAERPVTARDGALDRDALSGAG